MKLSTEALIRKVRAKVFSQYRTHGEVEDIMQEASVYAWKRQIEGWDDGKIISYSGLKALSIVSGKSGDAPTGKPVNYAANRKQANGDASREKLRAYLVEYEKLHGEQPTNAQTSRDLGMPYNTVRYHRNRLYLFDGGLDSGKTYSVSLDHGLDAVSSSSQDVPEWVFKLPSVDMPTDTLATQVDVRKLLAECLSERDRHFLYLEFWEDRSYVEIARELKVGGAYVNKMRKRILAKLEKELTA